MTREDYIKNLQSIIDDAEDMGLYDEDVESLQVAIKALEQEPCEDAISRQMVLDINESHHGQMPNHINHQIWQEIKDLPPVRPQEQKTGHWEFFCQHWRKCSECGYPHKFAEEWDYCPNCGARMESEVRNDRGRN